MASFDLSFQLLKVDAFLNAVLGKLTDVVSESLDPFLAVGLSFSNDLLLVL